ncbi:DUF1918 domain-containing protein [Streptomyces mirabilis]|uniref:DUF1918 domain-containing protein n=1 Tax=Streptomyces TaxID=1883 RepID=UPI0029CA2318|nr:DUF1918 domain-containing protein [Streptomyces sp. AK02-04a]
MRAHLGDQLVIESPATGAARRDGEIVGLHHSDGPPPYDVHRSDTDEVTLVFPGPDAYIRHVEHVLGRAHERSRPGTDEATARSDATPPGGTCGGRGNGHRLRGRPCGRGHEPGLECARRRSCERGHRARCGAAARRARPHRAVGRGRREMWVSNRPTRLTGRRISPADR